MAFVAAPLSRTLYPTHELGIIPTLEPKDPDALANYVCNWGEWLDIEGSTCASMTVAIDGAVDGLLALSAQAPDNATPALARAMCGWFAGGTAGKDYLVRFRIVKADGGSEDRSFWLPVRGR